MTKRFPELREEFRERISLGEGDVDRLVNQARRELRRITSQLGWSNHWNGEGNIPDYSPLTRRLERLVEIGHADAVARLGREIITQGIEHVGQSDDEGETGQSFAQCAAVVFKGVAASSLPPREKLLFAIDAVMEDDYGVIGDDAGVILESKYSPADWSLVADELSRRLQSTRSSRMKDEDGLESDFHRNYQRDQISGWLIQALENADRRDEVLPIYEREARRTGSYERLVSFLIEQKRYEDARRWATEGIERTCEKLPGIAHSLARLLGETAVRQHQWDIAAAHAALEFFDEPAKDSFDRLMKTAEKAGCAASVRDLALQFLETGACPVGTAGRKASSWPLPVPDYLLPLLRADRRERGNRPHFNVLIDMAIAANRPDEVLKWYDRMRAAKAGAGPYADKVAKAVAESHPERALEIYRRAVDAHLGEASISAYETVAGYLRKMRPIMKAIDREEEWMLLLADIRMRYRNRPRFMEILDKLERRPIVAKQAPRGRRDSA